MTTKPTINRIKRHNGVADTYAYSVIVTYPDEELETVTFHGSAYGGPVVMETPGGTQVFVADPTRFGDKLDSRWVRRFFEEK